MQALHRLAPWLTALSLLVLATPASAEVGANMKDQLIFHFCNKAMLAEFHKAGKTPPAGMVAFTCSCVVQRIDARASIEQAKATCQARAAEKYPIP